MGTRNLNTRATEFNESRTWIRRGNQGLLILNNSNGQLTKSIDMEGGHTKERRYDYNADGDLVREEFYIDGKPYQATSYEFDDKVSPSAASNPRPKGTRNFRISKPIRVRNTTSPNLYITAEMVTNGLKDQGLSIRISIMLTMFRKKKISKSSDFGVQYASELSTYQYQDCD